MGLQGVNDMIATTKKYVKRPIPIEAFRLGIDEVPFWFTSGFINDTIRLHHEHNKLTHCDIQTLEGTMRGQAGDYIIKGIHGEIYPCKADIFEESYEEFKEND